MKYIEGDIFTLAEQGKFDFVIHGCNCQNAMGSGIAKTVRDKYPKAYAADMATQKGDIDKLGHFTHAHIPAKSVFLPNEGDDGSGYKIVTKPFSIINAYTQAVYWDQGPGIINLDYEALKCVFKGIKLYFDTNPAGVSRFAIPKIGAVRGGGDWSRIEDIIDSVGIIDLTCVIYNGDTNK